MVHASIISPDSHQKSDRNRRRRELYRLKQGVTPDEAARLSRLADVAKNPHLSLVPEPVEIRPSPTTKIVQDENRPAAGRPIDLAELRKVMQELQESGQFTVLPKIVASAEPVEIRPTASKANSADEKRPKDEDRSAVTGREAESLFSVGIAALLYLGATGVQVYLIGTALGGGWLGWATALVLGVGESAMLREAFEARAWALKLLLLFFGLGLTAVSFQVQSSGVSKKYEVSLADAEEAHEGLRNLRESRTRLSGLYDSTPPDQLTNRKRLSAQIDDVDQKIEAARARIASSSLGHSLADEKAAGERLRLALIFIAVVSMHRLRRGFSDPQVMAAIKGVF